MRRTSSAIRCASRSNGSLACPTASFGWAVSATPARNRSAAWLPIRLWRMASRASGDVVVRAADRLLAPELRTRSHEQGAFGSNLRVGKFARCKHIGPDSSLKTRRAACRHPLCRRPSQRRTGPDGLVSTPRLRPVRSAVWCRALTERLRAELLARERRRNGITLPVAGFSSGVLSANCLFLSELPPPQAFDQTASPARSRSTFRFASATNRRRSCIQG